MRRIVPAVMMFCVLWTSVTAEVEIPPGFEIVDVIVTEDQLNWPVLNDCGQIAYPHLLDNDPWMEEIFLYDNGQFQRITHNEVLDTWVDLNDRGEMVWGRGIDDVAEPRQVILYRDGVETMLQEDPIWLTGLSLNNRDEAVWSRMDYRRCPVPSWIYRFDGVEIEELVFDPLLINQEPRINDQGWITWMHTDFCESSPWAGTIQLYREGQIIDLPSSETQVQGSKINNRGQVVWDAQKDLELWEDGNTQQFVDTDDSSVPNIGDTGDVYFSRAAPENRSRNAWLYASLEEPPRFYRLSDDARRVSRGSVNAWGEVAWLWYRDPVHGDLAGGIVLMRRIRTGDSNFDGSIDKRDHKRFVKNITGPIRTDGLCDARFLDTDYDGDLDLADFAAFQNAFAP